MKCKMERCETWDQQIQSLNETFILGALNMVKISSAYRSKFSDRRYKVTMDTYGLTPWLVTLVIQGILGGISYELRAPLHTGDLREDYLWVESCPIYRVSKGGLPMSWEREDYLWVERGGITYELRAAPHKGKELEVVQTPDTVASRRFHSIDGLQLPDKLQVPKHIISPSLPEHLWNNYICNIAYSFFSCRFKI